MLTYMQTRPPRPDETPAAYPPRGPQHTCPSEAARPSFHLPGPRHATALASMLTIGVFAVGVRLPSRALRAPNPPVQPDAAWCPGNDLPQIVERGFQHGFDLGPSSPSSAVRWGARLWLAMRAPQHACPRRTLTDASSRGCLRGRYADSVLKGYATAVGHLILLSCASRRRCVCLWPALSILVVTLEGILRPCTRRLHASVAGIFGTKLDCILFSPWSVVLRLLHRQGGGRARSSPYNTPPSR